MMNHLYPKSSVELPVDCCKVVALLSPHYLCSYGPFERQPENLIDQSQETKPLPGHALLDLVLLSTIPPRLGIVSAEP